MQVILTSDMNTYCIASKFVSRLLTPNQEELCQDLNKQALDDPTFISRVITGDKTWVYGYDEIGTNSPKDNF